MTYDSVIWDCDGVLVDSRDEAWHVASEILALLGLAINIQSQSTFREYFTQSGFYSEPDRKTMLSMHRMVMKTRAHKVIPFPCLSLVSRLNVPSEIITSSSTSFTKSVLGEAGKLFRDIRGSDCGSKNELLQSLSPNAIFITDTIMDIERCHKRFLPVIAVGWGYDPMDMLIISHPTFFVESLPRLESLFKDLKLL